MKYWLFWLYVAAGFATGIDWASNNLGLDSFLLAVMFGVVARYEYEDVKRKELVRK